MFAEGLSATDLDDDEPPRHENPTVNTILTAQDAYDWLAEVPFVTVATMHGSALGAGLQLALACDIRIAARGTRMGLLSCSTGSSPTSAAPSGSRASSASARRSS